MVGIIILFYIAFVSGVVYLLHRLGMSRLFTILLFFILLLGPLWESFLGKGLMMDFYMRNKPLQQITKTVEMPGSVLWIDNVCPGFDENARKWMVESYLDGVRLKVLALNDGKGHLYVYRASEKDFAISESMRSEVFEARKKWKTVRKRAGRVTKEVVKYKKIYFDKNGKYRYQRKQECEPIITKSKVYPFRNQQTPENIKFFNYRVEWKPIALSEYRTKYIWCDEIEIMDLKSKETIGINKRCLQYTPTLSIISVGGDPFEGGEKIGDLHSFHFDDKVLFEYAQILDGFESNRSHLMKKSKCRCYKDLKKM